MSSRFYLLNWKPVLRKRQGGFYFFLNVFHIGMLFFFLLQSCNSHQNISSADSANYELVSIRSYEFHSGFASWDPRIYRKESEEYIAFADFVTQKKIVTYKLQNLQEKREILIDSVLKGRGIDSYTFINKDSILLLTRYSSELILINSKGQLLQEIDLLKNSAFKNKFEFSAPGDDFLNDSNELIFGVDMRYAPDGISYTDPVGFTIAIKKNPYLVKIKYPLGDTINWAFGLTNFYSGFIDSNLVAMENKQIYQLNQRAFICSRFSDTIYEIDRNNFALLNKFHIQSEFTKLACLPLTDEERFKNTNLNNELGQTKGAIYALHYLEDDNVFLVVAKHEIPISEAGKRKQPWSILIYDENFHKLDELIMDETKYSPLLVICEQGILICDFLVKENDKDIFQKSTYELFKLVKK